MLRHLLQPWRIKRLVEYLATYEEAESYIGKAIEESDSCISNVEKGNFKHRTSFAWAKHRNGPKGDAQEDDEEDDNNEDNNIKTSYGSTELAPLENFSTDTISTIREVISHTSKYSLISGYWTNNIQCFFLL